MIFNKDIKEFEKMTSVHQLSFYIPKDLLTKEEADTLLNNIYNQYEEVMYLATIRYCSKPSFKLDEKTKKVVRIPRSTKTKYLGFHELGKDVKKWLRVPSRTLIIQVRGIEDKKYVITKGLRKQMNNSSFQREIPKDFYDYLIENKLIGLVQDESKAYFKIYEFTDLFYQTFYRHLGFTMTAKQLEKVYKSYSEEGLDDIKLRDHGKFYNRIDQKNATVKPKKIKHMSFVRSKNTAFEGFENDVEQ